MRNLQYIIIISVLFLLNQPIKGMAPEYYKGKQKSTKVVTSGCLPSTATIVMEYNNVRAMIYTGGDMWYENISGNAMYEIPKGSGKSSLYAGGIWIGGIDETGQLRLAARTYRSSGHDYWPGPLTADSIEKATIHPAICNEYDKHYVITRKEVENFVNWFNASDDEKSSIYADYTVPQSITNWPGSGPGVGGNEEYSSYSDFLAPFKDVDGDNEYHPENGDYPNYVLDKNAPCKFEPKRWDTLLTTESQRLFGDQTIWWVYNDMGNIHTQSTGAEAIGMEIKAQGFAYSTNDELNNMTFYNYQVINRSSWTLNSTYFGIWTDADLGSASDDFVGCDVSRGLGYLYNADNKDGSGTGNSYGENPPAVGIDFFEGPYIDPNNYDEPSYWDNVDRTNLGNCKQAYRFNDTTGRMEAIDLTQSAEKEFRKDLALGSVNGLNFGDGIKDNERWGMRRFIYYNIGSDEVKGDPHTAVEFYNYLKGKWKNGQDMKYGGDGANTKVENVLSNFMFPGDTDECNWGTGGQATQDKLWTEVDEENKAGDRRFVQSAGPFTLKPGMVNDVTIGAVWAQGTDNLQSIDEVLKADIKAQRLFENCFQLIDGPDAPDVSVVEMDQSAIFMLSNQPNSNNYLESYAEQDPFIADPSLTKEQKTYKFQGYQVYQLKHNNVTGDQLEDRDLARIVFQCDVKDGVTRVTNFVWDTDIKAMVPAVKVDGADEGIKYTFELSDDKFAEGEDKKLVNYKEYYYLAVAYAYNNYSNFNPSEDSPLGKQLTPYLAGRNVTKVTIMPQPVGAKNNGTKINAEFGDIPQVTLIEGLGNLGNFVELTDESIDNIFAIKTFPQRLKERVYKKNAGPINVSIIDPLNVKPFDYTLKVLKDSIHFQSSTTDQFYNPGDKSNIYYGGFILDSKWMLEWEEDGIIKQSISSSWLRDGKSAIFPEQGIIIDLTQVPYPLYNTSSIGKFLNNMEFKSNGFIGATMDWKNPLGQWLDFMVDQDENSPLNWIRSGRNQDASQPSYDDYVNKDDDEIYEKILGGKWAPYQLVADEDFGLGFNKMKDEEPDDDFDYYRWSYHSNTIINKINSSSSRLPNVNIVITNDTSKWTRSCVIEMAENDNVTYNSQPANSISQNGALRFTLRKSPSLNKKGVAFDAKTMKRDTVNIESPGYMGTTGMSWFPGYAIDVISGERLNIAFGEDSWFVGENGADMLFNPTDRLKVGVGEYALYGKHYIWVFPHNEYKKDEDYFPSYDGGRFMYEKLAYIDSAEYDEAVKVVQEVWKAPAWCAIAKAVPGFNIKTYDDLPDNELTIKIRVTDPLAAGTKSFAYSKDTLNSNYPMFKFSTKEYAVSHNVVEEQDKALERIGIVPNPYYGFSTYETSTIDTRVKIINLPEECTITIYNTGGQFVRQFKKSNDDTQVIWDLKNTYGIPVASGIYLVHIETDMGEKVIKWYGSIRPVDLSTF
jgi:hypothetical protein